MRILDHLICMNTTFVQNNKIMFVKNSQYMYVLLLATTPLFLNIMLTPCELFYNTGVVLYRCIPFLPKSTYIFMLLHPTKCSCHQICIQAVFLCRFSLFGDLFDEAIRNGLTALQVCRITVVFLTL